MLLPIEVLQRQDALVPVCTVDCTLETFFE